MRLGAFFVILGNLLMPSTTFSVAVELLMKIMAGSISYRLSTAAYAIVPWMIPVIEKASNM